MSSPSEALVNVIYDYKDQLTDEAWIRIMDTLHKEYKIEKNNNSEYKYNLRVSLVVETTMYHIEEDWKEEHDDYYDFSNDLCVHKEELVKTQWEVQYKSNKPINSVFIPRYDYDYIDYSYETLTELNIHAKATSMAHLFGGCNDSMCDYHYSKCVCAIERGNHFYVVRGDTRRYISSVKTVID